MSIQDDSGVGWALQSDETKRNAMMEGEKFCKWGKQLWHEAIDQYNQHGSDEGTLVAFSTSPEGHNQTSI